MFTYVCCRCPNCTAQIILEEQGTPMHFVDFLGHVPDARLVHTVERCSCLKPITSPRVKHLSYKGPKHGRLQSDGLL